MASDKRIYVLSYNGKQRLVRAMNPAQAIRHVAESVILCEIPDQDHIYALARSGVEIEEAVPPKAHDPVVDPRQQMLPAPIGEPDPATPTQ